MIKKILIIAGGTGGHIFPGIAVGDAYRSMGCDVIWLGSEIGMEKKLLSDRFPFYAISVYQLRGKGLKAMMLLPWRLLRAVYQSYVLLKKIKPDLVVSFGGFVSGPGSIAAKLLGIPLMIHEQNARAGLTNRWLSKIATQVFEAFPQSFSKTVSAKTVGNPVREAILALPLPVERLSHHQGPLRLFILGGSLGAAGLNHAVLFWLQSFHRCHDITIKHQAGEKQVEAVRAAYATLGVTAEVTPFIDDMAEAWRWTDVVICRSGALTVSEVAAAGVAAIFVPLPHSVDNHQYYNADYLASRQAAIVVEQTQLTPEFLSRTIDHFLDHRDVILSMSAAARSLSKPQAISDMILS